VEFEKRIEKIREFISNKKIDAFFTKNQSHIFYLTGLFEIDGILLIDKENLYLFVSPLYLQESLDSFGYNKRIKNLYIKELKNNNFQKFISRYKKVGFIETEISLHSFKNLKKQTKAELVGIIDDIILNMRMKKEREEIELIKKAKEITEKTMEKIKEEIKEGITELDLTAEIKYQLIKNGARKESFEPIVASGINSSYPHHKSKNKKIKNGEVIVIDMGADFFGYKSDLTETFFCGKVDDEIKKIYNIVEETKKICIEYCENENLRGKDIYKKAVENLKKYNLEKFFIHGLGHGIGIDVHEKPYLNKKGNEKIEKGFVFTIEPGIYLPGKFGIRLESMFFK
jgi:Xaa-Pro aminopeptidase